MGQCPGSLFFWSIGTMVPLALLIATASHDQSEANESSKGHESSTSMIGHPQPHPTTDTLLQERSQAHFSFCIWTGFSSGHFLAPVSSLPLVFPQYPPPVKMCLPF